MPWPFRGSRFASPDPSAPGPQTADDAEPVNVMDVPPKELVEMLARMRDERYRQMRTLARYDETTRRELEWRHEQAISKQETDRDLYDPTAAVDEAHRKAIEAQRELYDREIRKLEDGLAKLQPGPGWPDPDDPDAANVKSAIKKELAANYVMADEIRDVLFTRLEGRHGKATPLEIELGANAGQPVRLRDTRGSLRQSVKRVSGEFVELKEYLGLDTPAGPARRADDPRVDSIALLDWYDAYAQLENLRDREIPGALSDPKLLNLP